MAEIEDHKREKYETGQRERERDVLQTCVRRYSLLLNLRCVHMQSSASVFCRRLCLCVCVCVCVDFSTASVCEAVHDPC